MKNVKNKICEILKTQQNTLCSAIKKINAANTIEVVTLDIAEVIDKIVTNNGIDCLHVLLHLLTSAQNGGIEKFIDITEVVIPLTSIRNVLRDVKMLPVELDTNNLTYKHCLDECNDWIVISYTQQKLDIIEFTHSADCKCSLINTPNLPMQCNLYKELKELSNTIPWANVPDVNAIKVWWDKLVGRSSIECNIVWPALANLQYVSQPVLSVIPEIHDDNTVDKDIEQMSLYNRCWPRVERACGYASEGVHMTWRSAFILCKHIVRAGILLAFIHNHIRTGNNNTDDEIQMFISTERYNRHLSILSPLFDIAKKIKPNAKFCERYKKNALILLQRIGQQFENVATQLKNVYVLKPNIGYNMNELIQISEDQIEYLSNYSVKNNNLITNALNDVVSAMLVYIEYDSIKSYYNYSSNVGPRVIDTWAIRTLSHVVMSTSAAWADAYDDGDKLVAAMVFSNITQAIKHAEKWAKDIHSSISHPNRGSGEPNRGSGEPNRGSGEPNRGEKYHPFKPLMNMSRPIWNTTLYSGPCGIIHIKCDTCCKLDNSHYQFSWPGWWMSMCPKGTVVKAMKILGSTEQEINDWYINQQKYALKSLAGIGVLCIEYDVEHNQVIEEYDVIILSNANVMTLVGEKSAHSNSHDLMAVVLKYTTNNTYACGLIMLRANQSYNGTVDIIEDIIDTLYVANIEYDVGFLHGPCEHVSIHKTTLKAKFGEVENLECNKKLIEIITGKVKIK